MADLAKEFAAFEAEEPAEAEAGVNVTTEEGDDAAALQTAFDSFATALTSNDNAAARAALEDFIQLVRLGEDMAD